MYRSLVLSCILLLSGCGDGSQDSGPVLTDLSLTTTEDTPLSVRIPVHAVELAAVTFSVAAGPSHGTITGDGPVYVYRPAANYNGPDSITILAVDHFGRATATAEITVTPVNDAPVANPDSFATGFDAPLTVAQATLLANDTDVDGTPLTVASVTPGTHGTPSLGDTNVVFTPEPGFTGVATFTYTAVDSGGLIARAAVTVTVGEDTAPVAFDDAASTNEDVTLVIPDAALLANDTDVENQTLAISEVANPSHGTVSHSGTQVTFVPDENYNGPAGFDYTVTDGFKTDVGSVVVTVGAVNDPPVAFDDTATTEEDTPLALSSDALVGNDSDIDGDGLLVSAVTDTPNTHGSVAIESGVITYTPAKDYTGLAEFTYTVSDSNGGTATATVVVTVTPVNDPPVANDDAVIASEDTTLVFPASDLTANDTDVEGDTLTVISVAATAATHGSVTLTTPCLACAKAPNARRARPPGIAAPDVDSVVYVPDADYFGPASFDYTISDGNGGTATGHVLVSVGAINDAPVIVTSAVALAYAENADPTAVDDAIAVSDIDSPLLVGATVQITLGCSNPEDVLDLVTPPDGITVVGYAAASCTLVLSGAASPAAYQDALRAVTYANTSDTPSIDPRVVSFVVDDGSLSHNLGFGERALEVTAVNDAPVAFDDALIATEDTPLVFPASFLVSNDTDIELDGLSVIAVTATATTHGTVDFEAPALRANPKLRAAGSLAATVFIRYTPEHDYFGPADFDYTVSDGNGGTATGHVAVTVLAVNDAPVVVTTQAGLAYTENAAATPVDPGILVTDVDSPALVGATVQILNGCADPEDVLALTGAPAGITVTGYAAATCKLTLLGSASQADYQAALRAVTYANTSDTPSTAARLVVFTVDDGSLTDHIGSASRALSVTATNDAPVAHNDVLTATEDTPLVVSAAFLAANDTDIEGDDLTVTAVTATATTHGTVTLGAPNLRGRGLAADPGVILDPITYVPEHDYFGPADFDYTVSDGHGGTATGHVSITVLPVNDPPVLTTTLTALGYTENDAATPVDPALTVGDVDSPTLVSATVQILGGCSNPADVLALATPPSGITVTGYVAATCTLTLIGPASPAVYQAALRLVTYANTSDTPSTAPRLVVFTVDDGSPTDHIGGASRAITVTAVNDPPVAHNDAVTATEDVLLVFPSENLVANDTDIENDALTVTVVTATATTHGSVTLGSVALRAGAKPGALAANLSATSAPITYVPDHDYFGPADFDYTVSDGHGGTATGHVAVTVLPVNDAPVITTTLSALAYSENAAATPVDPGVTVIDVDSATLTSATVQIAGNCAGVQDVLALATPPLGITASYLVATCTLSLSGTVSPTVYQAALSAVTYANTSDTPSTISRLVVFTVDDGSLTNHVGSASRVITVTAVNDPPVAVDDAVTATEDIPLVFSSSLLTANDTDIEGDALTVTAVTATATTHGTVTLATPNLRAGAKTAGLALSVSGDPITYTPDHDYFGPAAFDYTVSDGHGGTATGHVAVTVLPVNDPPVITTTATALVYTENDAARAVDPGLTISDVDSSTLTTATIQILGNCASSQDVLALLVPPVGITVASYIPATCTLTLSGTATLAIYQTALRGVTYANTSETPSPAPRVVTFVVDDGATANHLGGGSRAITVISVNDVPVAVNDTVTTNEDTPLVFPSSNLVGNDTDADGDTLTVTAVTPTATTHGTVSLGSVNLQANLRGGAKPGALVAGASLNISSDPITYTPELNYFGPADFDYTVSDGHGGTATGHVLVTVLPVNDAPVVTATLTVLVYTENDAPTPIDPGLNVIDVDSPTLTSATVQILGNCTNPEDVLALTPLPPGITATYTAATCTLSLSGTVARATYQSALRAVTYVNTSEQPSTAARLVVFTVDDGSLTAHSGGAARGLAIISVDDGPVAVPDTATVLEDAAATAIPVLTNDTDVDGGPKSIFTVTQPLNGSVLITGGGTGLTYQPAPNYCNTILGLAAPNGDVFTYTLAPGGNSTTVTVTVTCVDDPPIAVNDFPSVAQGSTGNVIAVLANDTDIDGGTNTVALGILPGHGTATAAQDGQSISYTPTPGYCNQFPNAPRDLFTYTLTPGGSTATVSVEVTCTCGQNRSTDFVVGSNN